MKNTKLYFINFLRLVTQLHTITNTDYADRQVARRLNVDLFNILDCLPSKKN
jgi:hypothetical protein